MPERSSSFLDFQNWSSKEIEKLFSFALSLKEKSRSPRQLGETLALLFFEPSTRTRMSFETAGHRAGLMPLLLDGSKGSSLEKGESIEDSILNVAAMKPRLMVVRCGDAVDLAALSRHIPMPILNAGWGVQGHPTQALLDLLTLKTKWSQLAGKKLLIVGDTKHSRVVSSHIALAKLMGVELAQCGPTEFLREDSSLRRFASLAEGLAWADAVMALRFQFERHADVRLAEKVQAEYRQQFGLKTSSLKSLKRDGWILHPGPIHHGLELETEVLSDSRSLVLSQVEHGVYVREALLRTFVGESP